MCGLCMVVGFASPGIVCDYNLILSGMLVCSSFFISVSAYCVESLAHIRCYSQ